MTMTTERGTAPGTASAPQATGAPLAAAPTKIKLPREQDPRNPNLRLAGFARRRFPRADHSG